MSNVANLELCKTLHELSGWTNRPENLPMSTSQYHPDSMYIRYDLGYLLRKLPEQIRNGDDYAQAWLSMDNFGSDGWQFSYREGATKPKIKAIADTPEDACAKLCVELFKQGVLK